MCVMTSWLCYTQGWLCETDEARRGSGTKIARCVEQMLEANLCANDTVLLTGNEQGSKCVVNDIYRSLV